ncbi:SDR family NAD(P)-dependent oxidoreductase [Paenibacillus sp. Soil750]|uniref:SDR family NAD(P)-dependent oxidoreductase n=1 Tax=Paenibacillus sp. Soil750 TaxID=1736398 RepID=UPI0006F34A9B|nr:SDR family oxidoreductase [Paenibacillus sp. Soil750]KRE59631.1 short-chain dehydrogenase [Paenibacillus sp. Soil750]
MRFDNKVAIITGGGSGIGRETCLKFAQEGAKVVVADYNEATGQETVDMIKAFGGEASFKRADVGDFEQVESLVNFASATYGRLDVMFNNAGIGATAPLLQHSPEMYHKVTRINQDGVYYGILAAGRKMQELGHGGTIINTASVMGFLASSNIFGYNVAKAAVVMMSQVAALELAPYHIRVVGVAPGFVHTNIVKGLKDRGMEDPIAQKHMHGEFLNSEQIADTVLFLASDAASGINGSTIKVDDGYASFK